MRSIVALIVAFSFVFLVAGGVYAASTIGTNMSTTGTFTQTVGSATAARFQNAAGNLTVLQVDTTNTRVGVGAAPSTTFEVQGTASASYFFTSNSLQVGGSTFATVSYSRFGIGATGHSLTAVDDVLFTGLVEFDDKAFFDGTASVTTGFEVVGYASATNAFVTTSLVVGNNVASSTAAYFAEFGGSSTGTASFLFAGGNSSAKGSCFQLKDSVGKWIYMRFNTGATTPALSAISCR